MTSSRAEDPSLLDLIELYLKEEMPSRLLRRDQFSSLYVDGSRESVQKIGVFPIRVGERELYMTVDTWTIGMVVDEDKFQAFGGGSPLFHAADPEFFPKLHAHVVKVLADLKPGEQLVV